MHLYQKQYALIIQKSPLLCLKYKQWVILVVIHADVAMLGTSFIEMYNQCDGTKCKLCWAGAGLI